MSIGILAYLVRQDVQRMKKVAPVQRQRSPPGRVRLRLVSASDTTREMKAAALGLVVLLGLSLPGSGAERKRVLATFAPVFCFTAQVAGDAASVEMLLPESAEPHDFAFSPSDLRKLRDADVVVKNGLGLEAWLEKALEASARPERVVIDSSRGVEVLHYGHREGESGHDHEEGGPNPHVWLDPIRAIRQVENIRDGLAAADPGNADAYRRNASAFIERLRALDRELREMLTPFAGAPVISFHDALEYFAGRYGLRIAGALEVQPGSDPTPKYLRALRETATREKVRAFLTEAASSPRLMKSLADDLGIPLVPFDPMETGPASADFYTGTMRRNAYALAKALSR